MAFPVPIAVILARPFLLCRGFAHGYAGFGFGRRICPGSYIGERSLFIVFSRLLWGFNLDYAKDASGAVCPIDENAYTSGFSSHPLPFQCEITPRWGEVRKVVDAHAQQVGLH
jgi:cytochrome P450